MRVASAAGIAAGAAVDAGQGGEGPLLPRVGLDGEAAAGQGEPEAEQEPQEAEAEHGGEYEAHQSWMPNIPAKPMKARERRPARMKAMG